MASTDQQNWTPKVDMSNTTSSAFIKIDSAIGKNKQPLLGTEKDTQTKNHVSRVKVYTPFDDKTHTYFHSMSIDKDVADFMGTAELRCPYDSKLMEYWEPARAYCVIYGSNYGDYKILFIGRVREVNQQGYEIAISLQDYGWKFKQLITQSYAKDNVLGKDGYTIMKLIFQALKIDSWVITPTAKYRLQQVGVDSDGNITLNKKEIEHMPDLLDRLKKTDPNLSINKYTVYNKVKESELHNINNINYTLKYEKPTKIMQTTAKENNYQAGDSMYGTNYGSGGGSSGGGSSGGSGGSAKTPNGAVTAPANLCSDIPDSGVRSAMQQIWIYNRGYSNNLTNPSTTIINYSKAHPRYYWASITNCLNTLAKYCSRSDKHNGAASVKRYGDTVVPRLTSYSSTKTYNQVSGSVKSSSASKSSSNNKGTFGLGWNFFGLKL